MASAHPVPDGVKYSPELPTQQGRIATGEGAYPEVGTLEGKAISPLSSLEGLPG